ncbi:type II toxin-antitoxin system VapC family toxin [Desulfobacterota bacterium AH_259_B03_O07]|nr:type II toxin-antitoxin system VapC family toxin [Desulfobacterota bacterium AH_259_B03_O07]
MKALIDTHVFLWWITDDRRISLTAMEIIGDGNNDLYFSSASCWEIAIKSKLGRIVLPHKPVSFIASQLSTNSIQPLPIHVAHALNVINLPDIHKDPFDRMLISQAQMEKLPIMTSDVVIDKYDVEVIW